MENSNFKFNISLSVLNHLGRNLYRSFATVLGEAISNSWDANAHNVWIEIDRENDRFCIKDDGIGMTASDFQEKFLKIGYSKRKTGDQFSQAPENRPYIGRKGIGKLALLSCADKISVLTKVVDGDYVGGMIDNSGLDQAILDDVSAYDYELNIYEPSLFQPYQINHPQGTIICFEGIKDGIHNTDNFLEKIIALYFRFSLLDPTFNIFLNGTLVSLESLQEIADKTQFVWNINSTEDPYLIDICKNTKETTDITMTNNVSGFIASVKKPKDRNIFSTGERVGVDLFVNGRLRETDILKHIPSARIPESYLYGQVHFDALDGDGIDRFTSSREGVLSDDPKYKSFLLELKDVVLKIIDQWDGLRDKYREDGDSDNLRISLKERKAGELANAVFDEFIPSEDSEHRNSVEIWCRDLLDDAKFNFESYAECFVSENLVRKFIQSKPSLSVSGRQSVVTHWRDVENRGKRDANVTIQIRLDNNDLYYLSMKDLVSIADPRRCDPPDRLNEDEKQFTVIRDAVMHTSLLTVEAKRKLTTVFDNIKGKIKNMLSGN